MNYLLIHQNFPAQYRHLVRHLADQPGNRVYFITQSNQNEMPGVQKFIYQIEAPAAPNCHPHLVEIDLAVRRGFAVADACRRLRDGGVQPDIVVGHCGWGETLFVKDVFPDVALLTYFEFFYHAAGADIGFDPEFAPRMMDDGARLQIRNAINRMSFAVADWGHTATRWQRSLYPATMQRRISVLHEGVNTSLVQPNAHAWLRLARKNQIVTREDEVITYVARNLEPHRGFHIFMRALPTILKRHPKARIVIIGGDGVSYGDPSTSGRTYREAMLNEVGGSLDLDRVHFLGQVPYEVYLNVLQISSVHVYLTYPFVLSWSFIEAMAAGCVVIGSKTPPVLEVLRDRENGLAVDFFALSDLCELVDEVLGDRDRMQHIREAARATAVANFDLETQVLPAWVRLLENLAGRNFPAAEPLDAGLGTNSDVR